MEHGAPTNTKSQHAVEISSTSKNTQSKSQPALRRDGLTRSQNGHDAVRLQPTAYRIEERKQVEAVYPEGESKVRFRQARQCVDHALPGAPLQSRHTRRRSTYLKSGVDHRHSRCERDQRFKPHSTLLSCATIWPNQRLTAAPMVPRPRGPSRR